jgi:chemotaxis protein MotB
LIHRRIGDVPSGGTTFLDLGSKGRSEMSGKWILVATVLLAGMFSTGCMVPKKDLDEACAMSRKAHDEMNKAMAEANRLREENNGLRAQLASGAGGDAARAQMIASLEAQVANYKDKFEALKKMYDELAARPAGTGDINVLPKALIDALGVLAKDPRFKDIVDWYPDKGMLKFKSDMTFAPGSADVNPAAVEALKKVAEILNIAEAKPFNVYVAGHTDDIPITNPATIEKHGSNWGLSAHRALSVVEVLAKANVDQERMAGVGFSKYHPVAPNAPGNKGNEKNRRVELWIVPADKFLTAEGAGTVHATPAPARAPAPAPVPQ